jgi:PKD repeat protein
MSTKSTIRKSVAVAAVALAFPAVAGAIPVNDDDNGPNQPFNPAPVARLSVTPNPALITTQPVLTQARTVRPGVDVGRFGTGDLVKFSGAASSDDSGISRYEFDLDGNGTFEVSGTDATASRRYTQIGTYHVKLRVTDDMGKTKMVLKDLIVHAPPKAVLQASTALALVGQSVAFDGNQSSDADGIVKHEFDLDSDGTYETTGATANTAFTTLGEHTVRLRVTDGNGATSTDLTKVVVHRAPTAAFTFGPAVAGQPIALDGSGSSDDGSIKKYEWDLDGDGTFETDTQADPKATLTVADPSTRIVRLRVTDDHGVQDAVAHDVTVTAPETVTAADTDAPLVQVLSNAAKLRRAGNVLVKVTCPPTETTCTGKLALRAKGRRLGTKAFSLTGGQATVVTVHLSKKARRAVKQARRLSARAIATATDAAGNKGTTRKVLVIKR